MAQLTTIEGIGPVLEEKLKAAGIDSLPELAQRNAENLAAKKLVRAVPSAKQVTEWVEQAKSLPRVVTH